MPPVPCFRVHPEVPGSLGPHSDVEYDERHVISTIHHLELIIEGWVGAELLKCSLCICVTSGLWKHLKRHVHHGISVRPITTEVDFQFRERMPDFVVPELYELVLDRSVEMVGEALARSTIPPFDLFAHKHGPLYVTARGRKILEEYGTTGATFEQVSVID